jgi:hypothetical protein
MERKRAVLFMMEILEVKEAAQKTGTKRQKQRKLPGAGFGESPCGFGSSMG